ncbi:hypothetical protein V6N11_033772 [Hibiscus sabdariffa]|uniref:Uncharacterized protein n=1 Tax=Hibiscus sabdariffa TaxID=183260 RepID=A0ABR2S0U9_9ROSI
MRKIDVADVVPIQITMPKPAQSEHTEPSASTANPEDPAGQESSISPADPQGSSFVASATQGSFAATPSPPAPTADPQPSPTHSTVLGHDTQKQGAAE